MVKKVRQTERYQVRRPCIKILRTYKGLGQFNHFDLFYWSCPPDLGKLSVSQIANAKADGYEKGVVDLTIVTVHEGELCVYLIEFKSESGRLTPEQKAIFQDCQGSDNIKSLIIRSTAEFQDFIQNELLKQD